MRNVADLTAQREKRRTKGTGKEHRLEVRRQGGKAARRKGGKEERRQGGKEARRQEGKEARR